VWVRLHSVCMASGGRRCAKESVEGRLWSCGVACRRSPSSSVVVATIVSTVLLRQLTTTLFSSTGMKAQVVKLLYENVDAYDREIQ
jgi:hypothetical protein